MKPEEARQLLDGTTPGPWEPHPDYPTVLVNLDQKMAVAAIPGKPEDSTPEDEANLTMIAATPDMAKTIAGMRTEYAPQLPDGQLVGVGWSSYESAREHRDAWRRDGYDVNIVCRYVTAPQPLGEEMTEPTITYEELRRAFMEDDCSPNTEPTLYALLEKNQPEPLFGRWATHPQHGRGFLVSDRPNSRGNVRFACQKDGFTDGTGLIYVSYESLDLDPATLTTAKDFNDAPEGTIVEMMIEPKGVYVKEGYIWYGAGDVYAYSARDLTKARVIRWGENDH